MVQRLTDVDPEEVGRYRLIARLGQGGMGVVHLVESDGGQNVAVKVRAPIWHGELGQRRLDRALVDQAGGHEQTETNYRVQPRTTGRPRPVTEF